MPTQRGGHRYLREVLQTMCMQSHCEKNQCSLLTGNEISNKGEYGGVVWTETIVL